MVVLLASAPTADIDAESIVAFRWVFLIFIFIWSRPIHTNFFPLLLFFFFPTFRSLILDALINLSLGGDLACDAIMSAGEFLQKGKKLWNKFQISTRAYSQISVVTPGACTILVEMLQDHSEARKFFFDKIFKFYLSTVSFCMVFPSTGHQAAHGPTAA